MIVAANIHFLCVTYSRPLYHTLNLFIQPLKLKLLIIRYNENVGKIVYYGDIICKY